MTEAKLTWSSWQALLRPLLGPLQPTAASTASPSGSPPCVLNVEEHTITQLVLALEQPAAWKALESFAEYGGWHRERVTCGPDSPDRGRPGADLVRLPCLGRSMTPRSIAVAPTSGAPAPSTSTPPAAPIGPPPSAPTIGSSCGALLPEPSKPAWFLPHLWLGLLPQVAVARRTRRHPEFHTKCELAVALLREQARIVEGKPLRPFSTAATPWRACPAAGPARGGCPTSSSSPACDATHGCTPCLCPRSRPQGEAGDRSPSRGARPQPATPPGRHVESEVAGRDRNFALRPTADNPLEGNHLPVAGPGLARCRSKRSLASVEGYKERFTPGRTSAVET